MDELNVNELNRKLAEKDLALLRLRAHVEALADAVKVLEGQVAAVRRDRRLPLTKRETAFLVQNLAAVQEGLEVGIEEGLPLDADLVICKQILTKARSLL